jgi:hypothetical protein
VVVELLNANLKLHSQLCSAVQICTFWLLLERGLVSLLLWSIPFCLKVVIGLDLLSGLMRYSTASKQYNTIICNGGHTTRGTTVKSPPLLGIEVGACAGVGGTFADALQFLASESELIYSILVQAV